MNYSLDFISLFFNLKLCDQESHLGESIKELFTMQVKFFYGEKTVDTTINVFKMN